MKDNKKFIQDIKLKKGALSRQLGIPEKKNIPMELLMEIKRKGVGTKVKNPTKTGKKMISVTPLTFKRTLLAINLKNLKKK